MPEISVARTITVVTLPQASQDLIREAVGADSIEKRRDNLKKAFAVDLFGMPRVGALGELLSNNQVDLLLCALEHAVSMEHGHNASVHFLELASEYELEGIGIEIRDDTVTEEKVFGPVRVMFVSWHVPEA